MEYTAIKLLKFRVFSDILPCSQNQGRGVHVTGVSAAYTFKLNKNILSE
jgi:hypothetical protein